MITSHFKTAGAIGLVLSLAFAGLAEAAPKSQNTGGDDCYNEVTKQCNAKYPDKDWGDAVYRKCINDGLDKCDAADSAANQSTAGHAPATGVFVAPIAPSKKHPFGSHIMRFRR